MSLKPPLLKPAPRAVIVARVSGTSQEDNTSLDAQVAACHKDANEAGASVAAIFTEVISGTLYLARPDMQEALRLIETGVANILITAKLDRAGRDVDALRDIKRRVERAGGEMRFANGLNFPTNAIGRFMYNQFASVAELEPDLICERMMNGRRAQVAKGIMVNRTFHPLGYHVVTHADVTRGLYPPEAVGKYQIVEAEAPIVRDLFERAAQGHSLRALARHLNESGVPTRRGAKAWEPSTLTFMLRNELYKGVGVWGKEKSIKDESRAKAGKRVYYNVRRPREEWYTFDAPAIVSAALWARANQQLDEGSKRRSGRNDRKYLLTGLLFCPHCGRRMAATTVIYKDKKAGGKHYNYPRYLCPNGRPSVDPNAKRCSTKQYIAKKLEALVLQALCKLAAEPALLTALLERQTGQRAAEVKRATPGRRATLQKEIATLERKRLATAESEIEARLSGREAAIFHTILEQTAARLKILDAELAALDATQREAEAAPQQAQQTFELLQNLATALQTGSDQTGSDQLDPATGRQLLGQVIDRIYPTTAGAVEIHLRVGSDTALHIKSQ